MRAMMSKHDLNKAKWLSQNLAYASVGSILVPTYPTVTSSRLWLDRNANVFSDTAGTTPASINGLIGSWRAVGGAWGTDLFAQSTGSLQPTLRSDGIQSDGVDDTLTSGASIAITGDYTVYFVGSRTSSTHIVNVIGNNSTLAGIVASSTQTYGIPDSIVGTGINDSATGLVIRRIRRSGNTLFVKAGVSSELSFSGVGVLGTMTVNQLIGRPGEASNSTARTLQIVMVTKNITPGDSDDLAIRAMLLSLEPGATDL
jgi:hypothetical protein